MSGIVDIVQLTLFILVQCNKEFYIDKPIEEFEVPHLDGWDGVEKQRATNEGEELRANEARDEKLQCEDLVVKYEKLRKTDFTDSVVSSSPSIEDKKALRWTVT